MVYKMNNDFVANVEIEKSKKKKLKKWQKVLIVIGFIPVAIFLMLCIMIVVEIISDSKSKNAEYTPVTTHISSRKFSFESGRDDAAKADSTPLPVRLSDSGLYRFTKFLSDVKIEYDYESLYNIDEVFERYKQTHINSAANHKRDIRVNGKIDAHVLYERVKENNTVFLRDHSLHKEYSDKKLREYCDFIAEHLPKIFEKYPQIDVDTVCCNLYDLKILDVTSSLSLAAVNRNNVLCINETFQEGSKILVDTDDIYTDTFYHELMHLCHVGCYDYKSDDEWVFGVCHEYEDLDVNPLAWFWLEEASAEMTKSYCLGVEPITYKSKIGYLESLNFILSLNKNNDLVQLEYTNFYHDIDSFFDLFGASSDEEILKAIRLMYTLETYQSSPSGFYEAALNEYGIDLNDEQNEEYFRVTVRCDILKEFTIMFYRNLAELINYGDVTLQDIYYLVRLYEADLNRHLSTNEYNYMAVASEFFENYCVIQNEFFKLISIENGMNFEDLQIGFENYSMNIINEESQQVSNYSLRFLSNDKRKWFDGFCKKIYKKGYPSMAECVLLSEKCIEEISEWNNSVMNTTESVTNSK